MSLFFSRTAPCNKSGWRKPAVVSSDALAAARSRLSHRSEQPVVRPRTLSQLRYRIHGGLTRAVLDESVRNCNCVTHPHGGLTPAALGNVRLCIAKIVVSPADVRTPTQERGRKPPVAPINAIATAIHAHARTPSAICRRTTLLSPDTHLPAHGGLTPAALVNVRLCTANVVIFQPTRTVQQERLA